MVLLRVLASSRDAATQPGAPIFPYINQSNQLLIVSLLMAMQTLVTGKVQYTDKTVLELRVDKHLGKLRSCDTLWLGYILTYDDGSSETRMVPNLCKQRDCDHEPCMELRMSAEYEKVKILISSFRRDQVSHVTLTFGKNQVLDKHTLTRMKRLVKLFFRQIQYTRTYKAVIVYELKRQPNGLYHCHCHIALERSPHLDVIVRKWNKINGEKTRVDVIYNTSKMALIRYFARRLAFAGVGVPIGDYVLSMKGRQLMNTYGISRREITRAMISAAELSSSLVGTRNNCTKKTLVSTLFLGTMPKARGETIPPPLSEWDDFC